MRLSTFSSTTFIVVGAFLIFGGCLSIALGIPSATPANRSYPFGYLGYGIWGGAFYIIVGIIDIVAGCRTTPDLVITSLVMNIICLVLGALQLALGITAANQDYNAMWLRYYQDSGENPAYTAEYSSFIQQFFPLTYKIAQSRDLVPYIHNGVIAVDSLLAFAGFLVAIVAAIATASGCRVVCCPNLMTDLDAVTVSSQRAKSTNQMMHENAGFQVPH